MVQESRTGTLPASPVSRRTVLKGAAAGGISAGAAAMIARVAAAQAATPEASPVASGDLIRSITREEYNAQLQSTFNFEPSGGKGGQVILATTTDIMTLNPHVRTDVVGTYIIGPMYNGLVGTSPIDGSMVPDLADYWDMTPDGLTFTFYLNRNATWHDGNPVTAADVVFSLDAALGEGSLFPFQTDAAQVIKSYRAIDDYTFELTALEASALFLSKAVGAMLVMPKHIWEDVPLTDWGSDPGSTGTDPSRVIGSGPFKFGEWVTNDHATVVRNDDYWDTDRIPSIDSFGLRVSPESSAAIQSLITGESDICGITPSQMQSIESSNPEIVISTYDTWFFQALYPMIREDKALFFHDKRVRKALYYAIDRELVVEQILFGLGSVADGPQPPPSPAYAPEEVDPVYRYDPEKAKALLEEAGWVDSDGDGIREKDGVKLSMELPYIDGEVTGQLAAYLQQEYKAVGMEILPVAGPQPAIIDQLLAGDFQLGILGITWFNDGDQGGLFRCDSVQPNGFNLSYWCNEEYDALDDRQLLELDRPKRIEILKQMSDIVSEDAGTIILYFSQAIVGNQPHLKNFIPNSYGITWSLNWMWVDQNA